MGSGEGECATASGILAKKDGKMRLTVAEHVFQSLFAAVLHVEKRVGAIANVYKPWDIGVAKLHVDVEFSNVRFDEEDSLAGILSSDSIEVGDVFSR